MLPAPALAERAELDSPPVIEPAAYLASIRELVQARVDVRVSAFPPSLRAHLDAEEASSRTFAEQAPLILSDESKTPEAVGWISDRFSQLMTRVVKVSARAAEAGRGVTPFYDIDPAGQDSIRDYVLEEYLRLCETLSATGKPSKTTYETAPFFYQTPENAGRLIDTNADLGRAVVTRLLVGKPAAAEAAIEAVRHSLAAASAMFPTINPSAIRRIVSSHPNTYEQALRKYAERNGLVVDTDQKHEPDAEHFLRTLRHLVRTRKYNLGQPSHSPALLEKARQVGQEVLAFIDEASGKASSPEIDSEGSVLKQGFRHKVETLVIVANRAWRKGDLPVTPEHASPEFRRELYVRLLGDFLVIGAMLGDNSHHAVGKNPFLYYSPEEIKQLVAANPDIAPTFLKTLIVRNTEEPQQAIEAFREKVRGLMAADPRLTEYRAMRRALINSRDEAPEAPDEPADKLSPEELIEHTRSYVLGSAPSGRQVVREVKVEIAERRPEMEHYYETRGWNFAGIELPEAARGELLKRMEEFIVANERAYRAAETATRLRDFDTPQRQQLYRQLAEDFTRISAVLNVQSRTNWKRIPLLYATADEVVQLRSEYDWLSDAAFCQVAFSNPADMKGSLERATRLKADLQLCYPGISDWQSTRLVLHSPVTTAKAAIAHLERIAERESRRFDSRTASPNPQKAAEIYRYLRTKFKYNQVPAANGFGEQTDGQIGELRERATAWLARHNGIVDLNNGSLENLLGHLEAYLRGSEALGADGGSPRILELPASTQNQFIELVYTNQSDLNRLVASQAANGGTSFRVYEFGFFHPAAYLQTLWRQYCDYLPQNVITYLALTSPRRPIGRLNELVEYRAELVRGNPSLSSDDIDQALTARVRG